MTRSRLFLWAMALLPFAGLMACIRLLPSLLTASTGGVVLREAVLIAAAVALLAILVRRAGEPPAMLGLIGLRWTTFGLAILVFLGAMLLNAATLYAAHASGVQVGTHVLSHLAVRPVWLLLLIALAAAISEEVVFRAIMLTHIEAATGSTWLGALVSLAAFAGAHAGGWGLAYVAVAALPGLVLTLFFLWRRDLLANILIHFLIDGAGLVALAAARGVHA